MKKFSKSEQEVLDFVDKKRTVKKWLIRHDKAAKKLITAKIIFQGSDYAYYRWPGTAPVEKDDTLTAVPVNLSRLDLDTIISGLNTRLISFSHLSDNDILYSVNLIRKLKKVKV